LVDIKEEIGYVIFEFEKYNIGYKRGDLSRNV